MTTTHIILAMHVQVCCLVACCVTNLVSCWDKLTLEVLSLYVVLSSDVHRDSVKLELKRLDLFRQTLNSVDRCFGFQVLNTLVNHKRQLF